MNGGSRSKKNQQEKISAGGWTAGLLRIRFYPLFALILNVQNLLRGEIHCLLKKVFLLNHGRVETWFGIEFKRKPWYAFSTP